MSGRRTRPEAGFALAAVLLMLLGLTALAHGTLLLARHQRAAAASGAAALQARLAAEAAVRRGARTLDSGAAEKLRRGEVLDAAEQPLGPHATGRVRFEPLGGEWIWAEGKGSADLLGLRGRRRTARVYWLLRPRARVRALRAAVEHGGELAVSADSEVRGGGPLAVPEGWPERICDSLALAAASVDEPLPAAARLAEAVRPGATPMASIPRLGLMTGSDLARRADLRPPDGVGTPAPTVRLGACEPAAWNWGEPLGPGRPCGMHRPLVVADGDLIVQGGRGQGVLAAAGALMLDGTRFAGLVLVGGSLRLTGGARIDGAARVRGDVVIDGRSTVAASPCAVHRSLAVRPSPLPPLPAPEGSWIPLRP